MSDERRPLGDTTEAHDEITHHDLPLGHPGRAAAVRKIREGNGKTTRGDQELADAAPRRKERLED